MKNNNNWKIQIAVLEQIVKQKGFTHQEIADKIEVKRQSVSRVFSLSFAPSLKLFNLICSAVGVNLFFEDKESKTDLNKAFEDAMIELGRRKESFKDN